ncbi:uncharacterized protein FIBRA_04778 [Fibroporia radiculosa]|uniref:Uncharacterized protein n=1 Tax=Fibroporia radiculosa TaxID=599839 RepID=J4G7Y1_9APHY|nr:uncharacterized protein FIBRA_04778 [Fibroporia radiculosa]CCM02673.1 predicted protein [Fibroporia radiculosa]
MAASSTHAAGERDARLENERLRKELSGLRTKYNGLKEKYREVKKLRLEGVTERLSSKRTSSQASLDTSSGLALFPRIVDSDEERPILRITKRPRLLGSPFDPTKAVAAGALARPILFPTRRPTLFESFDSHESVSDGEEPEFPSTPIDDHHRSGLPTAATFSPRVRFDSDSSLGSINFGAPSQVGHGSDDDA